VGSYAQDQDVASMRWRQHGQCRDAWIVRAVTTDNTESRGFATGLLLGKATVEAELTLSWSMGPVRAIVTSSNSLSDPCTAKAASPFSTIASWPRPERGEDADGRRTKEDRGGHPD